ncbi:16S rRNA (cytidine(1402)-2'-O)-methyltransferase [Chloroflexota bacterium]
MPTLYVVATPIGNLEDISLRALRVLREVPLIAAEDTRRTKDLLVTYDIKTPMTSYHQRNRWTKLDYIMQCLEGGDVALVSDAGMPGVSDPGYELVVAAHARGIPVVPIPGASAITAALVVCGLAAERFTYLGFLPHKAGERRRVLESVAGERGAIVILGTPHRLSASLGDIRLVLGDRRLAVCRELTKIHEEVFRGTVSQAIEHFTEPRGEFTIVIDGKHGKDKPQLTEEIEAMLRQMRREGITAREAIARVSVERGLSRRELYRAWLGLRSE